MKQTRIAVTDKPVKNQKLAVRIGIFITAATLIGIIVLWILVSYGTTNMVKNNITNQMIDAVESRAAIIENYVEKAEEHLISFSLGDEVKNLLDNPSNPAYLERAQKYTEEFAETKGIFEGLYIADTNTAPYTHITKSAIGKATRFDDRLTEFHNTILAEKKLTNIGIMQSPSSGQMVLSMYYPLFNKNICTGYVGAAVYANKLMDSLLELNIEGLPNSEYIFLNATTGVYLYNKDESLLNQETKDNSCIEIMNRIKAGGDDIGVYSDGNGNFTVYKYMKDRGWLFMVRDTKNEIFKSVGNVRLIIGIVCVCVAFLIIFVSIIRLWRVGKELMAVKTSISKLGRLDLEYDSELDKYAYLPDEIGMIVDTTADLRATLRSVTVDIDRILSRIAEGDLTVDLETNNSYYIYR